MKTSAFVIMLMLIVTSEIVFPHSNLIRNESTSRATNTITTEPTLTWYDLQWPPKANIPSGGSVNIYLQCYAKGITDTADPSTGIKAWIGYSSTNSNPNTWTNWVEATYFKKFGNNEEYILSFGSSLAPGIYYYAARFQYKNETYQFGGFNPVWGGQWDGNNYISGILAVGKNLATVNITNTLHSFDGSPHRPTITTEPSGLAVQATYNGSANFPINPGNYQVDVTVNDANYQGSQTATYTIYEMPTDEASKALREKFIWVMYDQTYNQTHLEKALSFHPDVINRGWFKWGNWGDFKWNTWKWMVDLANENNALLGGGGTVAALYPDETDNSKFLRMVDRNAKNEPIFLGEDPSWTCYWGDFQNKEFLDYLLGWMYQQIDAGADMLFLDGITDGPAMNTGYSDYSVGQFNLFLTNKFIDSLRWTSNDERWKLVFDVDFNSDCTNKTITTFDIRKYLKRKGYDSNPSAFNYPLKSEWGVAWNYENTYIEKRNREACNYLYTSLKNHVNPNTKPVWVTMNGSSSYTDFQTEGVWNKWKVTNGHLDISPCYIPDWRKIQEYSQRKLNRDIPLIVFHDWGMGMPFFDEISESDQILWLRVYAPEVFASGAIFNWPVSGGGNRYQPSAAVSDTIRSLIDWYSKNRNLFTNAFSLPDSLVNLNSQDQLVHTLCELSNNSNVPEKRVVHLINKKLDGNRKLVIRNNFSITVESELLPKSVWMVSPDTKTIDKLNFSWANSVVTVSVKQLDAYSLVVLDYKGKVPQTIQLNKITDQTLGNADFDPMATASSGLKVVYRTDNSKIATIVEGKVHIVAAGSCNIIAMQPGDANFEPATEVSQKLTINKPVGIKMEAPKNTGIFPNPCNDFLILEFGEKPLSSVQVLTLSGQLLIDQRINGNKLNIESLLPGIYLIKVDNRIFRFTKI